MTIEVDRLGKSYGQVRALDGVSFEARSGEILGYIGPNGAGKSTTIRILTGLVRSYEGTVRVDSRDVESQRSELHRRMGYVPQEAGFQEWRTVRHTLRTFGLLSGMQTRSLDDRITEVLDLLDIAEHADRRIVQLSGGTRQRLRFAQAILHDPQVLILDEPLNGLDPASRYQLKRTIRSLGDEQRFVLLSSHILSELEDLATRIAILDGGRLQALGTPEELRRRFGLGVTVEICGSAIAELRRDWFGRVQVERLERLSAGTVLLHLAAGTDLEEAMVCIMRALADRNRGVRSIRHLQPSLEDVYLSLTGGSGEGTR